MPVNPSHAPVGTELDKAPKAPAVRSFADLAAKLDASLEEINKAKAQVESTTRAAASAQERLNKAVSEMKTLQTELLAKADEATGVPSSGRVRVS